MEEAKLQSYILDKNNTDSIETQLQKLLSILRKHLDMDVAFIAEFVDEERVFQVVDTEDNALSVEAGASDPLEETYCKKIVDDELENIICDTSKNDIANALDVTKKLSIGSYMGVPIILSDGKVYGTFCCFKTSSDETINQRDLSFLQAIAEITCHLIEDSINAENIRQNIIDRIQSVIDKNKIEVHYQPIYNLQTKRVTGFEALTRFMTEPYRTPDIWFSEASQVSLGEILEIMAIDKAIRGLDKLGSGTYISVNTSPEYILNGAVSKVLSGINLQRIVLEVTEHSRVSDYSDLRQALEPLRQKGLRLAIDDAGAGYSSFQHILELEADLIKLDISLTKNIHLKPRKYLLAKAICAFARSVNCTVIAEGVETTEELNVLRELGVNRIQGYLIGRPMPLEKAIFSVQNEI